MYRINKPVHCVTFTWSFLIYRCIHTDGNLQWQTDLMSFVSNLSAKSKLSRVQLHAIVQWNDAATVEQLLDLQRYSHIHCECTFNVTSLKKPTFLTETFLSLLITHKN